MKFTPISEQEAKAQSANLWPDGEYDFEVREATEKTSKADNDMTELEVWIYNAEGGRRLVFDYLVSSSGAAWKIRHFAASCGLLPQYDRGALMASEMVGRTGKCTVSTQKATDNYPAKNTIRDYIKAADIPTSRAAPTRVKAPADDLDDSIPF